MKRMIPWLHILRLSDTRRSQALWTPDAEETTLNEWLWNLTGLWNFAVKKIEHDAHDKVYHSGFDCQNWIAGHGDRMEIPSPESAGLQP